MRILFLSENFPPEDNSLAMRTHGHARYWAKWGHDVTVLTSAPNFPEGKVFPGYRNQWRKSEIIDGIKVIRGKACISKKTGLVSGILKFVTLMMSSFILGFAEKKTGSYHRHLSEKFFYCRGMALGGNSSGCLYY